MGRTAALYVFVAMGQAIVIVIGGMNLSLGAIGGLSVVMAGMAMQDMGLHPVLAFGVALGVGVAAGLTNGLIIVKLRLNSFVATLATSFIFVGLVNGISKGNPYTNIPKELTTIGRGDFFGFPVLFVLMLVLLTIVAYFFRFAVTGRRSSRPAAMPRPPGCPASGPTGSRSSRTSSRACSRRSPATSGSPGWGRRNPPSGPTG